MANMSMMRLAFFAAYGLLPLWASIAIVFIGAHQAYVSGNYWAVAPWLIIMGVLACGVTLTISSVTLVTYDRTDGDHLLKLKRSVRVFAFLHLAVAAVAGFIWIRETQRERDFKKEELKAIEYVKKHKDIASVAGDNFKAKLSSKEFTSSGEPRQYDIFFSGSTQAYAIVNVSRSDGKAHFSLACITHRYRGQRDPSKDACNQ